MMTRRHFEGYDSQIKNQEEGDRQSRRDVGEVDKHEIVRNSHAAASEAGGFRIFHVQPTR
jgi:hypothetical protein